MTDPPTTPSPPQVLFHWAGMEWHGLGYQGSARHLWRRAADLSYKHPEGAGAGGHAQVRRRLGWFAGSWVGWHTSSLGPRGMRR